MEKYVFSIESSEYIRKFISKIRNDVLNCQNENQQIILFLDPQTELAEFKFEYYDEHSEFKEFYGGVDSNIFNTVIELFQWTTYSKEFSFMDCDAIEKIKNVLTDYFKLNLPEYKDEVDYCYALIELEE